MMRISKTKNRTFYGVPVTFVEVGDQLFFGGSIQETYEVTHIDGGRPFCGKIDLFKLSKTEQPVCLTTKELNYGIQ